MASETLIMATADIVAAHVSNNNLASGDVPALIQSVYDALVAADQPAEPEPEVLNPAVSIRSSVKADAITCLECGATMKMLKRHLGTEHNLTPAEYKARWGLKADYPLVAPNYSQKRKELAVKIGLGRGARGGRKAKTASANGAKASAAKANGSKGNGGRAKAAAPKAAAPKAPKPKAPAKKAEPST